MTTGEKLNVDNRFFEQPVLNSPYEYPDKHWELDEYGQPTQRIIEIRRSAKFITPIPKPRKRKGKAHQQQLFVDTDISTAKQQYDPTSIINEAVPAKPERLESHTRNRSFASALASS
jgi:type III restriction enzyme